jgi:hypothetical protein
MPTTAKSQKKAILQHVLDDVLQDSMDDGFTGPIGRALEKEKIIDVLNIISYSDDDFSELLYQDLTSNVQTLLSKAESNRIKLLKGYINWRTYIGQSASTKDYWMAITADQLNEFRITTTWFGMTTKGTSIL